MVANMLSKKELKVAFPTSDIDSEEEHKECVDNLNTSKMHEINERLIHVINLLNSQRSFNYPLINEGTIANTLSIDDINSVSDMLTGKKFLL